MTLTNRVQLRVYIDNHYFQTLTLSHRTMILGSDAGSDLHINHNKLSRHHVKFDFFNEQVFITDLNSTNGTIINGRALKSGESVALNRGDSIVLADVVQIEFLIEYPEHSPHPSSVERPITNELVLVSDSERLELNRFTTLTLTSLSEGLQHVAITLAEVVDGVDIEISPQEQYVPQNTPVISKVEVNRSGFHFLGGEFPVTFIAQSPSGAFTRLDTTVYLRPRYGLLLLLVIFLLGAIGSTAFVVSGMFSDADPTQFVITEEASATIEPSVTVSPTLSETPITTSTITPSLTVTNTATPSATSIPSSTPTIIITSTNTPRSPTFTPEPTRQICNCLSRSNAYQVQRGDTVLNISQRFNVSIAEVLALNTCISNANILYSGETICLPVIVPSPTHTLPPTITPTSTETVTSTPTTSATSTSSPTGTPTPITPTVASTPI